MKKIYEEETTLSERRVIYPDGFIETKKTVLLVIDKVSRPAGSNLKNENAINDIPPIQRKSVIGPAKYRSLFILV